MLRVRGRAARGRKEKAIRFARQLRASQTDAETALWNRIRNRQIDGHKFTRQVPIGAYICDFVCREKQIVIEVDGGQHADSARDAVRDRYLLAEGYRVLRFWNNDVLGNLEGVLTTIQTELRG
jgi:very-short-patch-repair endonuclease